MVMRVRWRRLLTLAGIDRAIGWSAAPHVWSILFGPLTVLLITTYLTVEEQGYYFTFNSIVALQTVFDLGLASVIQQFVSHERAFLEWQPDGTIGGNDLQKHRLASLLRFGLKWYAFTAGLLSAALLIAGTMLFALRPSGVTGWERPWIAIALMAGPTLLLAPAFAILEGCGAVAEVARVRMGQIVAGHLAGWGTLLAGGRLWSPAAADAAALIVGLLWIGHQWRHFFADLIRSTGSEVSWRDEVWPFQWRTALSWTSNYFLMQVFTPILFLYAGAAEAGRMGMTLAIVTTLSGFSIVWLATKRPRLAMHVARREFVAFDRLFFPAAVRSIFVMLAGCIAFIAGAAILGILHHPWRDRLLAPAPLVMLTASILMTQIFWSESAYLRAHKQEVLLRVRLTSAALIVASALALGRCCGATGMMAGFLVSNTVVAVGWGTFVFLRKRREWHSS